MPRSEPHYGYCHALTPHEAFIKYIGFDEEANELPYWRVLDSWVEQAESELEKAQRYDIPTEKMEKFQAEFERRVAGRTEAMEVYNELNNAADELAAGRAHPYLLLSKQSLLRDVIEFTIPSLYVWAKESRGKVIPEWAPLNRQATDLSQTTAYIPRGAAKNSVETLYFIVEALGRLVDRLVYDEHIQHPTGKNCFDDNGTRNLLAIAEYIAKYPPSQPNDDQNSYSLSDRQLADIPDVEQLALGLASHAFTELAERARVKDWMPFYDKHDNPIRSPFHKKGQYASSKIYDYLIKTKVLEKGKANHGESATQHRLNDCKGVVYAEPLPRLSASQLLHLLQAGEKSLIKRENE